MVPGSGSATMPRIHWRAASICDRSDELILIRPSSSMSTLAPVVGDDLADDLAAGADDFADLVLGDLHRLDARRVGRELFAGVIERLGHFAEDVRAAVLRLGEGGLHDLLGDAGDLDVHLQEVMPPASAGDLEVHVAEVILVAEDVADHREVLAFEDQAHGDARHRALQRNAGVHHAERAAAHRRHRRASRWTW